MTKNTLLKIARIQQIDMALTTKGLSRQTVYKRIIYPSFFIAKRTYYNYLDVNAKKELREVHGLDWETALKKLEPINYIKLMEEIKSTDFFAIKMEPLSDDERQEIMKALKK